MQNYFNSLNFRQQLAQLGVCELLNKEEFNNGVEALKGKNIVIVGAGAQGLHQGLNMRDSGLDVSYALRACAIAEKRPSYTNAVANNFKVGTFEELIPSADLVCNLTPDKQHTSVIAKIMPLMKQGATLSYSHGFNIVEEGIQIRKDITVIMVAPKSPGSEVREEYKRGFGVPTLIAVHPENDPEGKGFEQAKAYAAALGSHTAGVLRSSFVAEVKSDLMGEQTILCGVLQTGSVLAFDKLVKEGIDPYYGAKLIQKGWEVITEALKQGGITNMMNRLSNPAKIRATQIADELKIMMRPLFEKHQDNILSGAFSAKMMQDWANNDAELLQWRAATAETHFEKTPITKQEISNQTYFNHGTLLVALVKAGVELAFEVMTASGMKSESAYYESLHELPLIANTIARKKLYEMNKTISDTAEYGNYLFDNACRPLLKDYIFGLEETVIGRDFSASDEVDNQELIAVNRAIQSHEIEKVGTYLRDYMTNMKQIR
ncbi:ketol-acid reductoisomerase [Capnocytophaga sp.]|uniref:ketol-acid reductoisomerase n=1 Tax=Capnocytophaga sp. TaxID=44737 RepID=UPI0026DB69FC|nr:ketol-acid reductoisomerase [Capnocytophaga sp.]MDO5104759.1 ketol-acid reductoisomerase [Capnocytophaga sp.]